MKEGEVSTSEADAENLVEKPLENVVVADASAGTEPSSVDSQYVDDWNTLPLLNYTRMSGSLPRQEQDESGSTSPLNSSCTCSVMGKVIISPEQSLGSNSTDTVDTTSAQQQQQQQYDDDLLLQPHSVLALGFDDGSVRLVSANTGYEIVGPRKLAVKERSSSPIVAISLDASSTFLAAINKEGTCAIWEIKYTIGNATVTSAAAGEAATTQSDNVLANLFGFGSGSATSATESSTTSTVAPAAVDSSTPIVPGITATVQVSRITYPSSFGPPTCLALDPSYKRRREKALMVGFHDGRLLLTKRGFFFQQRNDAVVYQGSGTTGEKAYAGIEAIAWRGPLVAWADARGIKLFDVETMTRIAHVDRPAGARSSLFSTISALKPTLLFEKAQDLLVAWGDTVMTLEVRETIVRPNAAPSATPTADWGVNDNSQTPPTTTTSPQAADDSANKAPEVKARKVECGMAWNLDCIACGVAPLDVNHIVVLGLVPTIDEEEDENDREIAEQTSNDVEVQVIARSDGAIVYADVIPLVRLPASFSTSEHGTMQESAVTFSLLSSFALSRMADTVEAEQEGSTEQDTDFNFFGGSSKALFRDPHLRWSMKSAAFEKEEVVQDERDSVGAGLPDQEEAKTGDAADAAPVDGEDDTSSVDSDDYSFILRSAPETSHALLKADALPPSMVVVSAADVLSVRVCNVDDAVSFALSLGKVGLALQRGLRHKRELRKHDINNLVDLYLQAVLRIDSETKSLSVRRLRLAAEATPMLLGGNVPLWERWTEKFSEIPGALFILRDYLPVRDPKLPTRIYEKVIRTLLKETEEIMEGDASNHVQLVSLAGEQAMRRFLNSLNGWGTVHALREKIKFLSYHDEQDANTVVETSTKMNSQMEDLERLLERRLKQSASGYLQWPPPPLPPSQPSTDQAVPTTVTESSNDVTLDSLFDVDALFEELQSRVQRVSESEDEEGEKEEAAEQELTGKVLVSANRVVMESLAELHLMSERYEEALKSFLGIGCQFPSQTLADLEKAAIRDVNLGEETKKTVSKEQQYGFVLAMIEYHHMHRFFLQSDFSLVVDGDDDATTPLIALIRLVGLEKTGDFLVEHSVSPLVERSFVSSTDSLPSRSSVETEPSGARDGHETLPINLVADQLVSSPQLLHWYLHLIFLRKPEVYVSFATTAVPPRAVTELHRTHLDLYIDYAADKDSALSLVGTERYNHERKTTPLLSFLKAALPLGGIRPDEVRRLLEAQRIETKQTSGTKFPHSFAIELAYVIEHYGKGSELDAKAVLDLYLKGANSVTLATSYVQRNMEHSTILWNELIQYCLESSTTLSMRDIGEEDGGSLFGSLLESAALCGADLALLVTRIPQGMRVEGLRPRLVAAVGDYRLKLTMHDSASNISNGEKIGLLRELTHRSRRGTRVLPSSFGSEGTKKLETALLSGVKHVTDEAIEGEESPHRPRERPDRYRLAVGALPMR